MRAFSAGTLSLTFATACAALQEPTSTEAISQSPHMSVSSENSLTFSRMLLLEDLQLERTSWLGLSESAFWERQPAALAHALPAHALMKPSFPAALAPAPVFVPVRVLARAKRAKAKTIAIPVRPRAAPEAIVRRTLRTVLVADPIAEPGIDAVFASIVTPTITSADTSNPTAIDQPATVPPVNVPTPSALVPVITPRNDAVYTSLEYESRFGDAIFGADAFSLSAARTVQTYGVLHSSGDTRSSAVGVDGPIIYNDNAEIMGGGARYNLSTHSTSYLFAEAGEGFSLVGRGNHPDFRYGYDTWLEKGSASRAHTSYGFSAASYSRYGADIISYGTVLHDFTLRPWMRGIVGANEALDTHRDYYNNIGEIVAGVRFGTPHLQLRLLAVAGTYLSRGVGAPISHPYTSFRPAIFWSKQL